MAIFDWRNPKIFNFKNIILHYYRSIAQSLGEKLVKSGSRSIVSFLDINDKRQSEIGFPKSA